MILKDALDEFRIAFDTLRIAFDTVEQAARADDKTPLQNALALSEAKDNFASSEDSPNVVVFADADRFKAINAAHGEAGGDAAINQIGFLIQEFFVNQCQAQAFRHGGDEFVILLQNNSLDKFKTATKSFTACQVQFDKKSFSVGVSFGYAVSEGDLEFEKIMSRAESACKKAKMQGSGTWVEWTEEIEQTAFTGLRETCRSCGTINDCSVPQKMNLEKLSFCAACGMSLSH